MQPVTIQFLKQETKIVALALFDLDNTLLAGDSDYEWGQYLVSVNAVDADEYSAANLRFYEQYKAGTLDIHEFARFAFTPLTHHPRAQLLQWRREFLQQRITPIMLELGQKRIHWHQQRGDIVIIITATNSFITRPIAEAFGVSHLLATDPEEIGEHFTGAIAGTPCFQQGKVKRLRQWMLANGASLKDSWFYSDSHNDLPLLEVVSNPVAIDADPTLQNAASERGWQTESFRSNS